MPDELKDIAEIDWLLKLFVERDHSTSIPVWSFISMRDMAHADADIQKTVTDRRANMEYDFKRELVDPVEMFVGRNFGSANQPHLSLQSKPHRTLEDCQRVARKKVIGEATKPAATLLIVDGLASPDMVIEIEAIAAKG